MSNGTILPPVTDDEWLARFLLFSGWIRRDQSIRPDAFIPHPWPDLSVTRHLDLLDAELWQIGQTVAEQRPATLYGRADVQAFAVTRLYLHIVPTPEPRNHASITGWPADKPAQKILAQQLAASARFVSKPDPGHTESEES